MAADQVDDSEATLIGAAALRLFDQLCDDFESSWQSGQAAAIELYLGRCPESQSDELFGELLALELEYRAERGELPSREEYLQRFPRHADTIHNRFARHESRDTKTAASTRRGRRPPTAGPQVDGQPGRPWGNYELLQELGRGGMGIVYRARQRSLNRIVALKMIVSGQFASEEQVRRFFVEAEAAAHLDHPGIVPVYEVGQHEGHHFYSMAFVEGVSLSDRLSAGPLPPREAAELLCDAARAMAHAHVQGVIHRDLKPSNILLKCAEGGGRRAEGQTKGRGPKPPLHAGEGRSACVAGPSPSALRPVPNPTVRPMITDFGLAKRVEANAELTATGDVLGTPNYMSPEQAAGRTGQVGPAADIYSLGATLYATLTGRPPFQAADVAQTLRQVIEREPVALRQLNAAVDRDLETICLKCLEKEISSRYPSADALADDLQRYLESRPILARPIGRAARLARWCRRNPRVAVLAGALLLALLTGTVVSTWFGIEATANAEYFRKETIRADGQTRRVRAVLGRERRALVRQKESLEETEDSIYKYVQTVKNSSLLADVRFQPLRKQLLQGATDHYQRYVERHRGEQGAATQAKVAAALVEVAWMNSNSGFKEQGLAAYRQALAIRERLARESPSDTKRQADLAFTHHNIGHVYREMGKLPEAQAAFEAALAIRERLAKSHPDVADYQQGLALTHLALGAVKATLGNRSADREALEKAIAIQKRLAKQHPNAAEFRKDLARSYFNEAVLYADASRPADALKDLEMAREIQVRLAKDNPSLVEYQNDLASTQQNIGRLYRDMGRPDDALNAFQVVLELRERIARENPTVAEYLGELAATHHILGNLHSIAGRPSEALAEWEQAVAIRERLSRDYPAVIDYRTELATSYNSIGISHRLAGRPEDALVAFRKALAIRERLAAEYPRIADYRLALARSRNFLGAIHYDARDLADAEAEWKLALDLRETLVREFPAVLQLQKDLSDSQHNLGAVYQLQNKPAEALAAFEKALDGLQKVVKDSPAVVDYQLELGSCYKDVGRAYAKVGKLAEAAAAFQSALDILERLTKDEPEITDYQIRLAATWLDFGDFVTQTEPQLAAERLDKSVLMLQNVLASQPGHPEALSTLRSALVSRGLLNDSRGQFVQAAADWEQWLKLNDGKPAKSITRALGQSLARSGEHRKAAAAVEKLSQELADDTQPLEVVRVYAICSDRVLRDESLAQDERARLAETYAAQAMSIVEGAAKAGRLTNPIEFKEMETSADFAPLRTRDAFSALLEDARR